MTVEVTLLIVKKYGGYIKTSLNKNTRLLWDKFFAISLYILQ